ncbi:MAG TPA: flagellar hook-length control protein FliK [Chloroflexota bacterium]|nr:flagellar hook-length control protein FliK [Chloroflexota bacterium]
MAVQALFGLSGTPAAAPTDGAADAHAEGAGDAGAFRATLLAALQGSAPVDKARPGEADDDAPSPTRPEVPADGATLALLALLLSPPSSDVGGPSAGPGAASAAPVGEVAAVAPAGGNTSPGLAADGASNPASGGVAIPTGEAPKPGSLVAGMPERAVAASAPGERPQSPVPSGQRAPRGVASQRPELAGGEPNARPQAPQAPRDTAAATMATPVASSQPLPGERALSGAPDPNGIRLPVGSLAFVEAGTAAVASPAAQAGGAAGATAPLPTAPVLAATGDAVPSLDAAAAPASAATSLPGGPLSPVAPPAAGVMSEAQANGEAGDAAIPAAGEDGTLASRPPALTPAGQAARPGSQAAHDGQLGADAHGGQTGGETASRQGQAAAGAARPIAGAPARVEDLGRGPSDARPDTDGAGEANAEPSLASPGAVSGVHAPAAAGAAQGVERAAEHARPLVDQLAHGLHLAGERPGQAVRLVLQPEGLGGVALRIGLTHAGVNVHIAVDNPATRELVQASWPQLSQALDQQGMAVDRVFVELAQSQLGQSGAGQQPAYQQASPRSAPAPAPRPPAPSPQADTVEVSAHRVDYRV